MTVPNLFASTTACNNTFFGLKPWYYYYSQAHNTCDTSNFNLLGNNGQKSDIPLVLLAVVDDLLIVAGIAAAIFIIYGGVKYITSQGSPEETAKAQSTIINALIGLVIAMVAIAGVSFIGNKLGA